MIELYQFPISHYCEKIRWALDYKQLDHKKINLMPGFHAKKTMKLVGRSAVPVLVDDGKAIKNSSHILEYLENTYPEHPLLPKDDDLRSQAIEWEGYADREIGPYVRCLCYHTLLNHPDIVIPIFSQGGPWYGKMLLKLIYPKLHGKMRKFMKINDQTAQHSQEQLTLAIDKIYQHRKDRHFMVGQSFTSADLAIAALLAPLSMPKGYGLTSTQVHPEPLATIVASWGDKLDWVQDIYAEFR